MVDLRWFACWIASRTSDAVGGSSSPSTFTTSMPLCRGVACAGRPHATSLTRIAAAVARHATTARRRANVRM